MVWGCTHTAGLPICAPVRVVSLPQAMLLCKRLRVPSAGSEHQQPGVRVLTSAGVNVLPCMHAGVS